MNRRDTPSATSLPQAPEAVAASRLKRYALTMGIRTACFLLMALVTPYGWYTWVFAAGAIFLPYVAVVMANAGESTTTTRTVESPTLSLDGTATAPPSGHDPTTDVFRTSESGTRGTPGVLPMSESPPSEEPT